MLALTITRKYKHGCILGMTNQTKEPENDDSALAHSGDSRDEAAVAQSKGRFFTADFVFATLANFIHGFGLQMLLATLPMYAISLGGSQAEAGLVSGASFFTALLFRPLVGWLTDAWRRRPVVLIGTSCYGLASLVYLLAGSIPFLVMGRFVHGLGSCCYTTAAYTYVADITPLRRRAEAVGLFAAAQAVGLIIGPVIGFLIIGTFGFPHLFYFAIGLSSTAFLFSFFTRERRNKDGIKREHWSPRTGIVAIKALPAAWIGFCMGMGFGTVSAFIAIFAQPRGVANPGFYFTIQAIALLISRTFAGRFADRYGRAAAIVPGILLMAIAQAILPFAHGLPSFMISALLFGLGFGTAQPATMALSIDWVRPEQRGLATGTYLMGYDAGISIGAILLGVVSQYWGYGVMWPMAAAFTLLGLAGLLADSRHVTSAAQ
jgi:MFS family permease